MLERDEVVIGDDRGYRSGGDAKFFVIALLLACVVFGSATAAWVVSDLPAVAGTHGVAAQPDAAADLAVPDSAGSEDHISATGDDMPASLAVPGN